MKESANQVRFHTDELGLPDVSLRQKPARLLGDTYTLAVSNTNATLQSNKSVFPSTGVRFACCCLICQWFRIFLVIQE